MHFRDILALPHDPRNNVIALETTRPLFPDTPIDIVEQFYTDHGRNGHFQDAYGHVALHDLAWTKLRLPAEKIVACSVHPAFRQYVGQVSERTETFPERGWDCMGHTDATVNYWRTHRTWARPPVFIHGRILGERRRLRLVEGHTRVGILAGFLQQGVIAPASEHEFWFGAYKNTNGKQSTPRTA